MISKSLMAAALDVTNCHDLLYWEIDHRTELDEMEIKFDSQEHADQGELLLGAITDIDASFYGGASVDSFCPSDDMVELSENDGGVLGGGDGETLA
jgi:hypothetical protein